MGLFRRKTRGDDAADITYSTRKGVLDGTYHRRAYRRSDVQNLRLRPDGRYNVTLKNGHCIIRSLAEIQRWR